MADLKLGTTLGGAAIWSASNLPLLPLGGQITYKGWRIYTENDRPTAEDIGALSLANGGTVNNDATFAKNITVGINAVAGALFSRSYIDITRAGNDPNIVFRRSDVTNTPTTEQALLVINAMNGVNVTAGTFNVHARPDGGNKVYITAYKSGSQNTALTLDSQAQQVTVEQGTFRVLGNTVLAGTTATTMAVTGALTAQTVTPANWTNHDVRYMTGIPTNMQGNTLSAAVVTEKNDVLSVNGSIVDGPYGNTTYNGQVVNFRRSLNTGNALTQIYLDNGVFHIRSGSGSPGAWSWVGGNANGWRKIYDENNKPTPAEIGALKNTTDTMNGTLTINSGSSYAGISMRSTTSQSEMQFGTATRTGHIGIGESDLYIGNLASGKYIQMTHTGALNYSGAKIYRSDDKPTPKEIGAPTTETAYLTQDNAAWVKIGTATVPEAASTMSIRITGGSGYNAENGQAQYADIIIRSNNGSGKHIGITMFRSGGSSPTGVGWIYTGANDNYDIYIYCTPYQSGVMLTWDGTAPTRFVQNIVVGTSTPPAGMTLATTSTLLNTNDRAETSSAVLRGKTTLAGYLQFDGTNNDIRGIYGDTLIKDHNNGNVTLSASRINGTVGTLYVGYHNPDMGIYCAGVRLETPTFAASTLTCNATLLCNSNITATGEIYTANNGNFNDVYIRSDEKLKSNFNKIENALDKVDLLDGLTYDKASYIGGETFNREAGLIAQQLQKVLPEAVAVSRDAKDNEVLVISPTATIALLVNAIKELREEVRELKARK